MPTQIENTEYYHKDEVAQVIGKSPATVQRRIESGDFKAKKFFGRWFVSRSHLESIVTDLNFPIDIIEYRLGIKLPKAATQ